MHVYIDEARCDEEASGIDDLQGFGGGDVGRDLGDLAVADGDVAHRTEIVLGVDDVAALDQQVILRLRDSRDTDEYEIRQALHCCLVYLLAGKQSRKKPTGCILGGSRNGEVEIKNTQGGKMQQRMKSLRSALLLACAAAMNEIPTD